MRQAWTLFEDGKGRCLTGDVIVFYSWLYLGGVGGGTGGDKVARVVVLGERGWSVDVGGNIYKG